MGVPIDFAGPGELQLDALAVPLARPVERSRLSGRPSELAASGEFRGDRAEALVVHAGGDQDGRIVLAGLGPRAEVELDSFRTAAAVTAQALARVGGTLGWQLDESLPVSLPDQVRALVDGTVLGGYTPGRWKTQDLDKQPRQIERIVIVNAETPELRDAAERAALVGLTSPATMSTSVSSARRSRSTPAESR